MLKRISVFIAVSALFLSVIPRIINYQGKLLDTGGAGVNGYFQMAFRLYTSEVGGSPIWEETIESVLVRNGLFSLSLGARTPFPDTVDFSTSYWLEVSISGETMTPRERLNSAPYAISAERALRSIYDVSSSANRTRRTGHIFFAADESTATITDSGDTITIFFTGAGGGTGVPQSLSQVLAVGNSAGGFQINMNFNRIVNLGEPVQPFDAVTKNYVDGLDGEALSFHSGKFNVNVDGSSIYIDSDTIRVKPEGITSLHIADYTIQSHDIDTGAITSFNIDSAAVQTWHIAAGSITTDLLAEGAVTGSRIAPATITSEQIAPGTIGTDRIAPDAITSDRIADGSVTGDDLYWPDVTPRLGDSLFFGGGVTLKYLAAESISALNAVYLSSWLSGWSYRIPVTITNTGAALAQYQVKIELGTSFQWAHCASDGRDIRVIDSDGSAPLPFWFQSWSYGSSAVIWVKVGNIQALSSKTIYIYYGNSSASDGQSFDNTFTKNFGEGGIVALYHMDEGGGTSLVDSSGRFNNGTIYGASWQTTDGGQWDGLSGVRFSSGSHLLFDGIDDYVSVPDATSLDIQDAITIEAWVNGSGIISNWWNVGWLFRREISISPPTPTNYYWVRVTISSTFNYGACKPNGEDIRFVTSDSTELKYWVESWNNGGNSAFWVRIPQAGTSSIWMYYGNNLATSSALPDDGTLTVSGTYYIDNVKTNISTTVTAGSTSVPVVSAAGFSPNDEILIINLQGTSSDYSDVGKWEVHLISGIVGNTINLAEPLVNSFNGSTQKVMVQRIPRYRSIVVNSGGNLTCNPWDGTNGGVIIFRAGSVVVSSGGFINASASGYRGGQSNTGGGWFQQGESISGVGTNSNVNNQGGSGGARRTCDSCDWSLGAGYAVNIGNSCPVPIYGGKSYGQPNLEKIYFGSGSGGSGWCNDNIIKHGRRGGGIIIAFIGDLTVNGYIISNGQHMEGGNGQAGGGAGGSIYLWAYNMVIGYQLVRALGGTTSGTPQQDGANPLDGTVTQDGSAGRIRLDYNTLTGSTNPLVGYSVSSLPTSTVGPEQRLPIIIVKGSAYGLVSFSTDIIGFVSAIATTSSISGGWNHIALVYNGTTLRLYVNGVEASSRALSGTIATNSNNLIIGEKFNGRIDEIRIYDRALSASEIRCHYERRRYTANEPLTILGAEETSTAIGLHKASATSSYQAEHFLGIAISSGAPGDSIPVRIFGVASGFSGLLVGSDYYLQDVPGQIGVNPGSIMKRVGTAITSDKLLISR